MARTRSGASVVRPRRRVTTACLIALTAVSISLGGGSDAARAQDPQCRDGQTISGAGTIGPASPSQSWTGPPRSSDFVNDAWCNWDHFYLTLTEGGSFRVAIGWDKATDNFDLIVCKGHIDVVENAPRGDQCKRTPAAAPTADTSKRLDLSQMDPGEYTVRVVYARVVDSGYRGVASFLSDRHDADPAERQAYPSTPNDPLFDRQWGLAQIEAPKAWQESNGTGHGITIGVVDSGVDLTHPDLSCPGKLLVLPGSKIDAQGAPQDEDGHGTHVAGIAAGCTHNGIGVAGVAPDARIMPVHVFDAESSLLPGGLDHMMAAGIRFACGPPAAPGDPCGSAGQGAHVINLSIGPGPGESLFPEVHPETEAALKEATEAGVVIVAAAGNFGSPLCEFPSLSRFVICVGATDSNGEKTLYSDFPTNVDREGQIHASVLAPGGDLVPSGPDLCAGRILSTYLDGQTACSSEPGYAALAGTSMASPHVAGVAALVYDRLGGERSEENANAAVNAIVASTIDLYAPGWDPLSGYGRVDALAAVQAIEVADPEPEASPSASPSPEGTSSPTSEPPPAQPSPSPSESEATLTVPHEVSLAPTEARGRVGASTSVTALVLDPEGEPFAGVPVEWATTGTGELVDAAAATDETGRASATLVSSEPGDQHVLVWTESCTADGRCWGEAIRHHGPQRCDIFGTRGDDLLRGTDAAEVVCGFGGNDVIVGGGGNDVLLGHSGSDELHGGAGRDRLLGGAGPDALRGEAGADRLVGGAGKDHLSGGRGRDTCRASSGDRVKSCRT